MGPTAPPLYPVESEALGPQAVERRRRLFALGRAAARDGLLELGIVDAAIPRGTGGEPIWPGGIVGAISHSHELAVAVVGRCLDYVGLGIDVEDLTHDISPRVARLVCLPSEMGWVQPEAGTERLVTLFSAKEAVFKALYPIQGVWLGFKDAELTWHDELGGFEARVLKSVGADFPTDFVLQINSTVTATWVLSTAFVRADVR
jgi:4'-phosphopantetheinyl transferase EntD